MIPINSPAYAGNSVFVSLSIINISLHILLTESTSYFPNDIKLINNSNYQEIHPSNLTVGLTPKYENKVPSFCDLRFGADIPLIVSHSLALDSEWGI